MSSSASRPQRGPDRRPSNTHRPTVNRPGAGGLRFGMFAVCVARDSEPELNKGKAKPLYDLLVTYADATGRDTGQGYPYREALAGYLDCSPQTIDRATKYLEKEMGLVTVERRKVEGKADENDANLYTLHDSWLIHGYPAPPDTPPQLVARYGHLIGGFDVDAWMQEYAPDFDLTGWLAAHSDRKNAQQEEQQERRRAARLRKRRADKKGSGVTGDVTLMAEEFEGGGVTGDGTCPLTGDAPGPVTGDALSTAVAQDSSSRETGVADAVGQSAGGFACAGTGESAGGESSEADGGCAASETNSVPQQRKQSPRPATTKTRPRQESPGWMAVRDALPAAVAAPGTKLYPGLHRAINDLLTGAEGIPRRSPEQIIARVNRRWYGENAEERSAAGYRGCERCTPSGCTAPRRSHDNPEGCDRIRNRNSWLTAAILAQDCPDPGCEDGQIIGAGACPVCRRRADEQRAADRVAAEVKARLEAETDELRAARAAADEWEDRRAAEERTIRTRLIQAGAYGVKLDYQVGRHMAGWRDRHPQPATPPLSHNHAPF